VTKVPHLSGDLASSLLAVSPAGPGTYGIAMTTARAFGTCGHFEVGGANVPEFQLSAVSVTSDDGRAWATATMPECGVVTSLSLVNSHDGFVLTRPGGGSSSKPTLLDSTTDGGRTWQVIGPAPRVSEVFFSSANVGLGFSTLDQTRAVIERTTNGGRTWAAVALPLPAGYRGGEVALGTPTLFGAEDGVVDVVAQTSGHQGVDRLVVDVTRDGGRSWTTAPSPTDVNLAGYSPGPDDGPIADQVVPFSAASMTTWVLLLGPTIYETVNGGGSWTKVKPDPYWPAGTVMRVAFTSASRGWAFGAFTGTQTGSGEVVATTDSGRVWRAITTSVAS